MIDTLSIANIHGLTLTLSPYGARILSIKARANDQDYELHEYYEDLNIYQQKRQYSGALIGPYANRVAGGTFSIGEKKYAFKPNEGDHLLHSGVLGWHDREWVIRSQSEDMVVFYLDDRNSDWPGQLECFVTYQVTVDQSIIIQMECLGEDISHINLTNHGYFNLDGSEDLSSHQFEIRAETYTELNGDKIPTGRIQSVADHFLDYRTMKAVGPETIDHNYVIDGTAGEMRLASIARSTLSGIQMKTYTTQPGLQVYTGNGRYFCMETQHFPDTVHHAAFPETLVQPPRGYKEQCIYSFEGLDQSIGLRSRGSFSLPRG